MRRSVPVLGVVAAISAAAWAVYWPAPVIEVAEGVFAQQVGEDRWTLSCLGPCAEDMANAVCANFEVIGEQQLDVNSRFMLTFACPLASSVDTQKES